ncbi:substrate-binding domain-containing protein [Streptomyces sp. NPDC007162]|uniref:substrate-binding domain-containing protein n=1 Tax=Streptomyces sp. NPDC007162 TaxID=3156917 RepID=UPI0033F7F380
MRESRLPCPDDLGHGVNDILFMDELTPPLTSARIPHTEMGVEAVRILIDLMTGRTSAIQRAVIRSS